MNIKNIFVIDGDDVILKTGPQRLEYLKKHFGSEIVKKVRAYKCNKTLLLPIVGEETYKEMGKHVYSAEGTSVIQPIEGALEGVKELAKIGKVYVLTFRSLEEVKNSIEWFKQNGFDSYLSDVFSVSDPRFASVKEVSGSKKVGIALKLGAKMLVDDDERHMPKNPVEGLNCLLFGPIKRNVGKHIIVTKTWEDITHYANRFK